jgi:hypothetical protein
MHTNDLMCLNRLLQSNRAVASELMTLANKAAPAQPDAWAAKVLALAQSHHMTTNEQILVAARVAVFSGEFSSPNLAGSQTQRIADIRQLAVDLHKAQSALTAIVPRLTSPAPERQSAQAIRAAFNNPIHWRESANLIVPNLAGLVGKSALAWRAVTSKFKDGLAEKMFDANVRGGALAVMSVMDAEGSQQTLTVHDLTALQYVAITDGTKPKLAVALETPTLHDTFHSAVGYGVTVREEIFGDAFSGAMVDLMFGEEADVNVDRTLALDQQPDLVKQLKSHIRKQFASASIETISREIPLSFVDSLLKNWSTSAIQNAKLAEETLDANGLLAHLEPASRQRINALIYGVEQVGSLEGIAASFTNNHDKTALQRELSGWLGKLEVTLQAESKGQAMSFPEFERRAARAVAFALVLERAAPGSLRDGPLSIGLDDAELAPALRALDLRVDFPKTLREVQRALGQQP